MSNKNNFCFDAATPVIYKDSVDGECVIESIRDAYKKHSSDGSSVYVCVHVFDEVEHVSRIQWKKATFCNTKSIQQVVIYLAPNEFIGSGLESDNVIRVTPNHVFPVLTKNGYKDVEAYLLQTGDKLIFESVRTDIAEDYVANEGVSEMTVEEMLAEGTEHYLDYRHILKVVTEDIDADSSGVEFYGITLCDCAVGDSKYIMTCNSCISHDSSL